ncbi:putative mitochondrial hypothetical protein [Leptomonas pyrrhocoris]|uniref:Uncharacterized protein n=1 Tax=Leptomonas pyrrhocoris TaxID=157538 RepID=A0A0M9G015_LEPPY|nr:putative mitochondrial hypothetical protein [Leptomonas pyrrhocoris]XP_015657845.1 putative mitochondrial hypothetical protein [Leptomonas pyrrhocoris]XP_015657846.1 putative mitochondrial hypothetical protein [Leptomonas pyrrhocoris]KPA79405.1 putative mitochondrial hypothetical protein [Leptomonas pyrrhocoris]KPA79406.1 putative mitochondrial hypothetical protein [Leptomonas pyrrhocoris]KPA79407.1 putative mitochondrial hypothetical protein [Leptomonas pyrrhocoris]|eukprot:XP_015657844.1 putative mitochondrial hypothetical protein [Leptomonas pyrrhocoris]
MPCRPCSTLGDIQAFIVALREREKLIGGAVQLCITEDMRVFAEHTVSSLGREQRRIVPYQKVQRGDAATTVAEALRSLQSNGTTAAASRGASTVSSSRSFFERGRPALTVRPTVVDLSRVTADEVRRLVLHIENTYPALKLLMRHTSGQDLQGTKLHTIHVELVPRARQANTAQLPTDVQHLVDTFKGESVGEGYHSCLRRALRDAFASAQLPWPSLPDSDAASSTLLALYAKTWVNEGFQLLMGASAFSSSLPTDCVECTVRHPTHGQVLGTTTLSTTAVGLRDLLTFCDKVAASYNPERYASVQQRIRSSPLHLVLPTSRLRVKRLLRKLLHYHYGCVDSDITFAAHEKSEGVFAGEITLRFSPPCVTLLDTVPTPFFVLAKTNGTARGKVLELAAVQAIQTLFPEIFEKQIAYHADVRAIQQSDRASASANVPPRVSRGLEAQLRWATQTINADFVVESVLLRQNTPYPLWGVSTGSSVAWLSQLFLLKPSASSTTAAAAASTPDVVRELCVHAFDNRKSRSENKVVAAALAKCFPDLCRACVKDAQEKNLIDRDGAPTPFEGVVPMQDSDAERFASALSSDTCLSTLVPTRSSVLQPLPACDVRDSALESFWNFITGNAAEQLTVRVRRGGDESTSGGNGGYTAACVAGGAESAGGMERVVCEATSGTEIGALFALLESTRKVIRREKGTTSTTDNTNKQEGSSAGSADLQPRSTMEFLAGVPTSLPTSTPLQTCIDAIGRLYGLRCSVRITQEGAQYTGELWGNYPVESAVLKHHEKVASTVFFLDRNFFLGRGHAESPFMSVVRAAQNVFERHVRVRQRAFHETVVHEGRLHLHPAENGCLARLLDAVVCEIKATSGKALTGSTLILRFHHGELYQLAFSVASGTQSIVLEETVSRQLLGCLHDFCTRVSVETGVEFLPAPKLATMEFHTPEQLLRLLCQLAYGLDLRVEVQQVHKIWHCRLSVPVTEELACCVAESSASRKKEAVDAAAMGALKRYFADAVPHIPSFAALPPSQSGEADVDAVPTSMDNYTFQMSNAVEDAPPST